MCAAAVGRDEAVLVEILQPALRLGRAIFQYRSAADVIGQRRAATKIGLRVSLPGDATHGKESSTMLPTTAEGGGWLIERAERDWLATEEAIE